MPTEEQLREIHRLAVLGEATEIAQSVGNQLTSYWLRVSRFHEVRDVSLQTLTLGPHADTLVTLGRAKHGLGERTEALELYGTALKRYEEMGDRQQALALYRSLGDVSYQSLVDGGAGRIEGAPR